MQSQSNGWNVLTLEVEKKAWGLAYKTVTKKLVSRQKALGLANPNRSESDRL